MIANRKRIISFVRRKFLGGELENIIEPKLDRAADEIGRLLDVRFVMMGHTHKAKKVAIGGERECWYLNSGAWIPGEQKERHTAGCQSKLTYIQVRDGDELEAELLRWCQRNSRPEPFHGSKRASGVHRAARRSLRKSRA